MKTFAFGTILCLTAAPLAAQTACPTEADLARGIRIDFVDGSHEIYRASGPGIVHVRGADPGGAQYQMDLAQGFHLLTYQGVVDGQPDLGNRLTYDYGAAPDAMPLPVAGQGWQSPVTVTGPDGPRSEPQKHAYGQIEPVQIGACTYLVMETTIAYATGDHYSEGVNYLPELGISYLVWNESDDMDANPVPASGISVLTK